MNDDLKQRLEQLGVTVPEKIKISYKTDMECALNTQSMIGIEARTEVFLLDTLMIFDNGVRVESYVPFNFYRLVPEENW